MKFRNKATALLLCAAVGIHCSLPVTAATQGGYDDCNKHHVHYDYTVPMEGTRTENCVHCGMCVSCTDDVKYTFNREVYTCDACGDVIIHDCDEQEVSRACNCSNSACCY